MSEKEKSIDSNLNEEKIKVYDNDDAYLFGDASLNESNEEDDKENILTSQEEISNKITQNAEFSQENEKNNYETPKNEKINNPLPGVNPVLDENQNISKEDALLSNKKYMINDITTSMENEQENEELDNNNKVNSIKEKETPTTYENESNESEVPLITLNFLSICQYCKNQFNSEINIPYLFKCGHFFCKKCIDEEFTDEDGIKCPNDGLIARQISELKILNNFINDKQLIPQEVKQNKKYCEYHRGQKLTHYIEDTKEFICVYCAFERFKSNPSVEIKDIYEKCRAMENKIDNIIEDNQQNVEIIQSSLRDIKKNKENEEKKINEIFNGLFEILKIKRDEILVKIEKIFTDNAKKLSQKLEIFSSKLEKSEKIKGLIMSFQNSQEEINFSQIIEVYELFLKELNEINKITLQKYKFIYEDELKIKGILSKFGSLELSEKTCNFLESIPKVNPKEDRTNANSNNDSNKEPFIKVNKENKNNNTYKIDNFYHYINNKDKQSISNEPLSVSNKNKHPELNKYNINANNRKNNINLSQNNTANLNKSYCHIKNNNNINILNNKKEIKKNNPISQKYVNNKNKGLLNVTTSSAYGSTISKIEHYNYNGGAIRVNTPKSFIKKYKYNLSLGQNYPLNNVLYLNSLNSNKNKKINNLKSDINTSKNSKSKVNKSMTNYNK